MPIMPAQSLIRSPPPAFREVRNASLPARGRRRMGDVASSFSPKELREFGFDLAAQFRADIHYRREGAFQQLIVRNTGVDQDAVVEIARQIKWVSFRCPGF